MSNRRRLDSLVLAGFCAFLFFYGLAQFGLIGADEPRYAQVAREMFERHDWITPTLGGQPWLEKPPLYYWQAMVAYEIFGVSDWAARLPSAVDATLLVLAVYFFLKRLFGGIELDGALIVASCAGIIGYARAASTDMPLTAVFGMGMLSWWSWRATEKKAYLALFFLLLALGMLAKGPVAPFLAFLVIALYAAAVREFRLIVKTFWLPGIFLFCAVALPWYVAVQMRKPEFFREFIIEQNLGRFSQNLYHHVQPFWYYLPVVFLALAPWAIFTIAGFVEAVRRWWFGRKLPQPGETDLQHGFTVFACCWFIIPVMFFSLSQSKLPGYILPAVPAGGLLLAVYLRERPEQSASNTPSRLLVVLHSLFAAAPVVPALLIAYLVTQHRIPGGQPLFVALAVATILGSGIALTLLRSGGFRMLRFITLIPVVLIVAAVLKLGSRAIDEALSARPLAHEIAAIETQRMPLAIYHVPRELEYGLTFYRNQLTLNYAWGTIPAQEHLLVAPENSQVEIAKLLAGRRVSFLGHYPAQHLDYFWIASTNTSGGR
jgi:4-amino-4-deoxy-L-arabinose transferase-like glycosyltransferase